MQVLVDELYQSGSPSWGTLFWQHFWQFLILSPSSCNSCSLSTASRLEPGRSCRHIRVRWQIAEPDMAQLEETRILLHDRAQTILSLSRFWQLEQICCPSIRLSSSTRVYNPRPSPKVVPAGLGLLLYSLWHDQDPGRSMQVEYTPSRIYLADQMSRLRWMSRARKDIVGMERPSGKRGEGQCCLRWSVPTSLH